MRRTHRDFCYDSEELEGLLIPKSSFSVHPLCRPSSFVFCSLYFVILNSYFILSSPSAIFRAFTQSPEQLACLGTWDNCYSPRTSNPHRRRVARVFSPLAHCRLGSAELSQTNW